jgi:hypothetical protein
MTGADLLHGLWARGIRCVCTPTGRVEVAPASRLTDDDRVLIRRHLNDIRALLAADDIEWLLEREGILIHDAGIDPHEAAAQAVQMLLALKQRAGRTSA